MPTFAPALLTTLLAGCGIENNFNQVWDVNPIDKPADAYMAQCLPPDESVCPLDSSGNIDAQCVDNTQVVQDEFKAEIEDYLLPVDATYEDFIAGRLPVTVQIQYDYLDTGYGAIYKSGGFSFSYGDHRHQGAPESELYEDAFNFSGKSAFPRWNCFANQDNSPEINPEVWGSVYPANDDFGRMGGHNDLWWEVESEGVPYFIDAGQGYYTDYHTVCQADVLCQTVVANLNDHSAELIDSAFNATNQPQPDSEYGSFFAGAEFYYSGS